MQYYLIFTPLNKPEGKFRSGTVNTTQSLDEVVGIHADSLQERWILPHEHGGVLIVPEDILKQCTIQLYVIGN